MLMSKSRLEKILYALYSLDSSDLPNPLSRIEELYKCLVTGEEPPTFEPLSRVEKYLMAILGVYDVDSLPNPLSRVEVLLYKLATGDDNLDDVKSFLSEHEELLAEIIRNGGVGGNIDIEYVLYTLSTGYNTLYNTAEKSVKSAILKGQTLVNHAQITTYNFDNKLTPRTPIQNLNKPLESGKQYTVIMNIVSQTAQGVEIRFSQNDASFVNIINFSGVGLHKYLFSATNDFNQFSPYINIEEYESGLKLEYNQLMIIEGDYTNVDVPFFEGMQSVKMPVISTVGKNLFNAQKCELNTSSHSKLIMEAPSPNSVRVAIPHEVTAWRAGFINLQLEPNTWYKVRCVVEGEGLKEIGFTIPEMNGAWNPDVIQCNEANNFLGQFRTQDSGVVNLRFNGSGRESITFDLLYKDIQIEKVESPSATHSNYEPFKSNILTVNEPVELRGIGDVKDELNLLTGELTTNIREYVYPGSPNEQWSKIDNVFEIPTDGLHETTFGNNEFAISNKFKVINYGTWLSDDGSQSNVMLVETDKISIKTNYSTIDEFRNQLLDNPLIVQVKSKEKSIKTVDLSTTDQDGNDTKLSTFDDITHVTLSSEGLIPEAELEVATKNEEVLNTMSLEMDDIFTTQTTLGETVNAQSENVDATMIATTEIYEELL